MDFEKLAKLVRQFANTDLLATTIENIMEDAEVETIDELADFLQDELEYSNW